MKFIRFGDSLLNLEQVVCFSYARQRLTADLVNSKDPVYEVYDSPKEAHDRFQEIVDIINSNAKPEPVSKGVVMTAGEAAKLPDILGKRVKVFDFYTADQIDSRIDNDDPLRVSSGDDDFIWLDKTQMIEVID